VGGGGGGGDNYSEIICGRNLILMNTLSTRSIDAKYLDKSSPSNAYRLETYRAAGSVSAKSTQQLRCYFVSKCQFVQPVPEPNSAEWGNISKVSDQTFLSKASENTLQIYQDVMDEVLQRQGPVIGE
jgi:glutamate dehydrogenase